LFEAIGFEEPFPGSGLSATEDSFLLQEKIGW
jgi:hypothetical protein